MVSFGAGATCDASASGRGGDPRQMAGRGHAHPEKKSFRYSLGARRTKGSGSVGAAASVLTSAHAGSIGPSSAGTSSAIGSMPRCVRGIGESRLSSGVPIRP